MVLLVFLVDTSASMNQKTCLGTTYLDIAKGAVDSFLKIRSRDINASRGDRYMLVTFDKPRVKAGWRENLQIFSEELKNLQATGLSDLGSALRETFDLLNMHRLQSGIDNYAMGRNPYYLEPALVLLLTNSGILINTEGVIKELCLPDQDLLPGGELTHELYRWDQRLFTLNLKIPGFVSCVTEKQAVFQPDDMPLSSMCDATGGKLYNVNSHKLLMQSMESIAQKINIPGVVIHFEKHGADPDPVPKEEIKTPANCTPKREEETMSPIPIDPEKLKAAMINLPQGVAANGFLPRPALLGNHPFPPPGLLVNGPPPMQLPPPMVNGLSPVQVLLPPPPLLPPPMIPGLPNPVIPPPLILPNGPLIPVSLNGPKVAIVNPLPPQPQQIPPPEIPLKKEVQEVNTSNVSDNMIRGNEQAEGFSDQTGNAPVLPQNTFWHNTRKMIFVRTNIKGSGSHWPIPENFWPDASMANVPPRDAQPIVKFLCNDTEPMVIDNMPFDKYELEPSPLTQFILERKQPNAAWPTFIAGSSQNSDLGYPFGYIKASTNLMCVNFFVMPYNYPHILPLLDDLFKIHKCKPSLKWRQSFEEYLQTMPSYYAGPLRNALRKMGAPNNLVPDHVDGSLSYSIINYLKKIKHQAKVEAERLINIHSHKRGRDTLPQAMPLVPQLIDEKQKDYRRLLIRSKKYGGYLRDLSVLPKDTEDKKDFVDKGLPSFVDKYFIKGFKNPFDVLRTDLLNQASRMQTNFYHQTTSNSKLQDEDIRHTVAISQMGNYQDYLQMNKPLREVDQSQGRIHTFGNPFKLKQDQFIAVDEADVNEGMAGFQNAQRKRLADSNAQGNNKVKKKRAETPPPSRRPTGIPNTPPRFAPMNLKLAEPHILGEEETADKVEIIENENKVLNQDLVEIKTVKQEDLEEGRLVIDDSSVEGDTRGGDVPSKEKHSENNKSMSQQLRKLQRMYKDKKDINTSLKCDTTSDLTNGRIDSDLPDTTSPILSILRTSLEIDSDEKTDDELEKINTKSSKNKQTENIQGRTTSPLASASTILNTPEQLTGSALKAARVHLQRRENVKLRLLAWRAIREKANLSTLIHIVRSVRGPLEAKLLFKKDIMQECERFHMPDLCRQLCTYSADLGDI